MLQVIPNFQFPCLTNDKNKGQGKMLVQLLPLTKPAFWKG